MGKLILLGLFFLAVGMMLNLHVIAERPGFVLAMAAALVLVKAAVITGIGLAVRMPWRSALALGLLLSQGGEFGFVLFAQAQQALLIAPEAASLFGAIVTVSMASTPFLIAATRLFRNEPVPQAGLRETPKAQGANALVVGYGRFGQTVAQMLIASDIEVTLIDRDVGTIDLAEQFGAKVYFGDGTRLDVLRQAGAGDAELIMFCIDGDQITPALLEAVSEAFPQAAVYVRAYDRHAVIRLNNGPANGVVREVLESAVKMARMALEDAGVSLDAIRRAEDMYRLRDKERLSAQIESGDIHTARDKVITAPRG